MKHILSSTEIKKAFLDFFQAKNHLKISDSSIIPKNDPTLLFINSGMAPIKNYFIGEETPPCPRLCNSQPCIRTIDIDEIGDKHHLTSFQMLGSWSIGDYFKEMAISYAYEFITEHLGIAKEKLYVTIFAGDENLELEPDLESKEYWLQVGVPEDHIVACGMDDNFWGPTSVTGPCGPCTEMFYDTGSGAENKYVPGGTFDTKTRYIEIWNAGVFMQFNKNSDGSYDKLRFTSVDTGAGLERLAMILGGYNSVYETDLLRPIKERIEQELLKGGNKATLLPERDVLVMTDHLRTLALILSEKVDPSNEGRGYIPRKLLRKCALIIAKAKVLSFDFPSVLEFVLNMYADTFPKFVENKEYILATFRDEYDQFNKVLISGLERLNSIKTRSLHLTGIDAFELVTTYGLPIDIIKEFTLENNMTIDETDYSKRLKHHKEISRQKEGTTSISIDLDEKFNMCEKTEFTGYDEVVSIGKILSVKQDNNTVILVTDRTCFYAESGGQCADVGIITNDNFTMSVKDVHKTKKGVFVHVGEIMSGNAIPGETVTMSIDKDRRQQIANNHTCVHLLQSALKSLLGNDIHQSGSKVEDVRLRFDFNYDKTITNDDIFRIEHLVNSYIRMNLTLNVCLTDVDTAIKEGATALFKNKYADKVRVVGFGNVSKELCGGTHTSSTGNIGLFTITSVDGIGKGIKRINAVTGDVAVTINQEDRRLIKDICDILRTNPKEVLVKLKSNKKVKSKPSEKLSDDKLNIQKINGCTCALVEGEVLDKTVRDQVIELSDKINGVVLFISETEKKQMLVAVSEKLTEQYKANQIVKACLATVGGKGGGNARVSTGGGIDANSENIIHAFTEHFSRRDA